MKQFRLPDVGEGLTEAEIVSWKVKPGDTVKVNEIIVEIETAKSLVELPCPFAGVVGDLLVDEGSTVDVGTPIITVDDGSGAAAPPAAPAPPRDAWRRRCRPTRARSARPGGRAGRAGADRRPGSRRAYVGAGRLRPAHDVGQAPPAQGRRRRDAGCRVGGRRAAGRADLDDDDAHPGAGAGARGRRVGAAHVGAPRAGGGARVLAKPPVRKLAKDLGVDLARGAVGPGRRVTREDVEAAAGGAAQPRRRPRRATSAGAGRPGDAASRSRASAR